MLHIRGKTPLGGSITIPGDKSLSHRALILGALANGISHARGFLSAGDTLATLNVVRALGVRVDQEGDTLSIYGGSLQVPSAPLDCDKAGTALRLLAGVLAGQAFESTLDGSPQLRSRPMNRIIQPLRQMGARIDSNNGRAPLHIEPAALHGIDYALPVASAQLKSTLLLAGLFAQGPTTLSEPGPARDHTERLLSAMGANISVEDTRITLGPGGPLAPLDMQIPGDFSSAAFIIVLGSVLGAVGEGISIQNVGLNPRRSGLLDALQAMGADISIHRPRTQSGESVGDLQIAPSTLHGTTIDSGLVVRMIDEFPVLAVAATQAQGRTLVKNAAELRVKESDRIAALAGELRKLGAVIEERPDGFVIEGPQDLHGAHVDAHDDHRLAMSLAVAGLLADGETHVQGAACAADSFPGFAEVLQTLGAKVSEG